MDDHLHSYSHTNLYYQKPIYVSLGQWVGSEGWKIVSFLYNHIFIEFYTVDIILSCGILMFSFSIESDEVLWNVFVPPPF